MSDDGQSTFLDGLFYGGMAYLAGYIYIYYRILADMPGLNEQVVNATTGKAPSEVNESVAAAVSSIIPSTWKYAGWVYHYLKGGSIGVSTNLLPGSYTIPNQSQTLFPALSGNASQMREMVLYDPTAFTNTTVAKSFVVHSPEALTMVSVTPTALFFAGFLLAYRNDEMTPTSAAIAGAKTTIGFLTLSVVGATLFTSTMSGLAFTYSGELSAGFASAQSGVEISPTLSIGPSRGRAILTGVVYPVIFGTVGGMSAVPLTLGKSPIKIMKSLLT